MDSINKIKIDKLPQIIIQAHDLNKDHLIERTTAYYFTKI